jgi:hypothetical protein
VGDEMLRHHAAVDVEQIETRLPRRPVEVGDADHVRVRNARAPRGERQQARAFSLGSICG